MIFNCDDFGSHLTKPTNSLNKLEYGDMPIS